MLRALDAGLAAGNHSFCEMRSSSLCAQRPEWCTMAGMQQLRPGVLGEFGCCNTVTEEALLEQRRVWAAAANASRIVSTPGQLMHRVRESSKQSRSHSVLFMPKAGRRGGGRGGRSGAGGRGGGGGKGKKKRRRQQKEASRKGQAPPVKQTARGAARRKARNRKTAEVEVETDSGGGKSRRRQHKKGKRKPVKRPPPAEPVEDTSDETQD